MKKIDPFYFEEPEQWIPEGCYCYEGRYECPFHDYDENLDEQENGYCHYLKQSDFDINSMGGKITDVKTGETFELEHYPFGGLLWDQVKECGVKDWIRWCLDCKNRDETDGYKAYCRIKHKMIDVEHDICDDFKPE